MEHVRFIFTETGDDLIVSFAMPESDGLKSLTLLRTPAFELLLRNRLRGVSVASADVMESATDLLRQVSFSSRHVSVVTEHGRYELDIADVARDEVKGAIATLQKMNFDHRFSMRTGPRRQH